MDVRQDEHERTLTLAETALGQIRALRQPALPRNFELWYQYAAGYNPDLNKSINETLELEGMSVNFCASSTITSREFFDGVIRLPSTWKVTRAVVFGASAMALSVTEMVFLYAASIAVATPTVAVTPLGRLSTVSVAGTS